MRRFLRVTVLGFFGVFLLSHIATAAGSPLQLQGQRLTLERAALGRSALLLPALIESSESNAEPALWFQAQPVTFELIGDQLYLLESPDGTTTRPFELTPTPIATFPVVAQSAESITFDFHGSALASLFLLRPPWWGLGATAHNESLLGVDPIAHLTGSYFRGAMYGPEWISLDTVIGLAFHGMTSASVFRLTFWFREPNRALMQQDDATDDWGYFHIERAVVGREEPDYYAVRWDLRRPITFYLSTNMPSHVRPTIRAGVLAWNHALGRTVVQVADGTPDLRPGDPRHPLIYWREDPTPSASAWFQHDPRTGEILVAMVLVNSGWERLLGYTFPHATPPLTPAPPAAIEPIGATAAAYCRHEGTSRYSPWWQRAGGHLPRALEERLALLQLRAVVMHEVGHVLGLRHNFAGSLDSTISSAQDAADLQQLIDGTRPTDAPLPSTSIMDYLPPTDDVRMDRPGAYDVAAVQRLYPELWSKDATTPATTFHFCTDDDIGDPGECQTYDSGADPIGWWARDLEDAARAYSQWVVDNVIIPARHMEDFLPAEELQTDLLHRLRKAYQGLRQYESATRWIYAGRFSYERAADAAAALEAVMTPSQPGTRPLVREPLLSRLRELKTQAAQDSAAGHWAKQTLLNIDNALDPLPSMRPPTIAP